LPEVCGRRIEFCFGGKRVVSEYAEIGVAGEEGWGGLPKGREGLQAVGRPEVVAVAEGDEGGLCRAQAGVAGDEIAAVVDADGFYGGLVGMQCALRGVGRAVIEADDLGGGLGLCEQGVEGFGDQIGAVIGGNDDGAIGHIGHLS